MRLRADGLESRVSRHERDWRLMQWGESGEMIQQELLLGLELQLVSGIVGDCKDIALRLSLRVVHE